MECARETDRISDCTPVEDYRTPPRMGRAKAARPQTDSDDIRRMARLRKGGCGPTSLLPAFRREPMPLPTQWIRIAPRRSDSWSVGAQVVGGDGWETAVPKLPS